MEHEHTHHEGSEHEHAAQEHHEPHHPHSKKGTNYKVLGGGILGIILIVIIAGLAWLYTGNLSQAKEKVFKAVPLPAAIVDMKLLPAKYVLKRIDLSKQLAEQTGNSNSSQIYEQVLSAKKLEAVAAQKHVEPTKAEIDEEYGNIVKQYANGDENSFKDELTKTYHMTPDDFKKEIVRQELLQSELGLWYNQQKDLNKAALDKANELLGKVNGGQSFEDVTKAYTEDPATKDFAGDSGIINFSALLPEFRSELNDAKVGDVKLVVSRYGVHVLKVLELNNAGDKGAKQIHLQQLFIKPSGFEDWMKNQTDGVRVVKLLKFS